jgi:F-type H+-transporting ATPase subunit delta
MIAVMITVVIVTILFFGGMIVFMKKYFGREVTSAISHLDKQAVEYAQKEEAVKKQYEDAKRQSQEIIANAQKDAQQQKEETLKQAHADKEKIVGEAHQQAEEVIKQADNARLALLNELEQKINERAVVKSSQLLASALPDDLKEEIHAKWLVNLVESSFENLDRLKIPGGLTEVSVVSAFALSDSQRKALVSKLTEKLGFKVTLNEQVDPAIIAGLVVTIGSLCLDGSLRFKIQEVARGER